MKQSELIKKLFNGKINGTEYTILTKTAISYISLKFPKININDLEDIVSILNTKLFNNDKFNPDLNIKEITYYTKSLVNEVLMLKRKKKRIKTISINFDNNEMQLKDDTIIYDDNENKVKDYIEINMPIFYEYLYTTPYTFEDRITYNFIMEKYNYTLMELSNLFTKYKKELVNKFTNNKVKKEKILLTNQEKNLNRTIIRNKNKIELRSNAVILNYCTKFNKRNRTEYTILQYDINNNFIKEWESHLEAIQTLNLNQIHLNEVLSNLRKSTNNYIFKYKNK
jgi:hypothetical protein